jgi:acyl carrier protein
MQDDLIPCLTPVFQEVFSDPSLQITESTSAKDVEGWDSFAHINLIVAIEEQFGVSFSTAELGKMLCVGDLVTLLKQKGIKV